MTEEEWLGGWPKQLEVRDVLLQPPFRSERRLKLFAAEVLETWLKQYEWFGCYGTVALVRQLADGHSDATSRATIHEAAQSLRARPTSRLTMALARILEATMTDPPAFVELANVAERGLRVAFESGRDNHNYKARAVELLRQCGVVRDIFGNPFRPVTFSPEWRTDTAVAIARTMYESREFGAMPILADALQDAGCDNDDILNHCRGAGPHVRGCWVVDLVLGKE